MTREDDILELHAAIRIPRNERTIEHIWTKLWGQSLPHSYEGPDETSALFVAISIPNNSANIVTLIKLGACLYTRCVKTLQTVLIKAACDRTSCKYIELLLQNGFDKYINCTDKDGYTALMRAACIPSNRSIEILCEYRADVTITTKNGLSIISVASMIPENRDNIDFLLKKTQPRSEQYELCCAASIPNNVDNLGLLLDRKYCINGIDSKTHQTALMRAVQIPGCEKNVEYLISRDAKLDLTDVDNNTALILAAKRSDKNVSNMIILMKKYSAYTRNNCGHTALHEIAFNPYHQNPIEAVECLPREIELFEEVYPICVNLNLKAWLKVQTTFANPFSFLKKKK